MAVVNVCFVGSGMVNFGGSENPWNHSIRLEKLGGVKIVAIVDPLTDKAQAILEQKLSDSHTSPFYEECGIYPTVEEALKEKKFQVAFIGVPPFCHGSFSNDLEVQLLKAGIHLFIEKPVSVVSPEEFQPYVETVSRLAQENGCIVSVGYMFRYHPAIARIKEELQKYGRPLVALNATYTCTYSNNAKPFWWDRNRSGGPIVEQGTHFCDLVRYFGGEVDLDSMRGHSVPYSATPTSTGFLNSISQNIKDAQIPLKDMAPCATQSVWRFKDGGGIGSLNHSLLLHDHDYETSIVIWADGLMMTLVNPYFPSCTLKIRKSGCIQESVETFPDVDTYYEEDRVFLEAVRTKDSSQIRSTYEDAAKTYALSWAIRRATETQ